MGGASEEVYVLSCGMCGIYWRATGWKGLAGALTDGGELRTACTAAHCISGSVPFGEQWNGASPLEEWMLRGLAISKRFTNVKR